MKKINILPYVAVFLTTYFILQWFQSSNAPDPILGAGDLGMKTVKEEYTLGSDIRVELQNNTDAPITLAARCPDVPLDVLMLTGNGFTKVENTLTEIDCENAKDTIIQPHATATLSLLDHSYTLFGTPGKYKLQAPSSDPNASNLAATPEFDIVEPGLIKSLWRSLLYVPLLNGLVAILAYTPGHSLALAILLLTLLIRTILLIPSQRAMKAQRRMQEIQPKIEELKKKYGDDQARLAQETMLLWKTQKVHPFSSCLPTLIQFPILIALYYTINGGLSADKHTLLYSTFSNFSLHQINASLFGFNLFSHSIIVLPVIVGTLQFLQMQLMTARSKKSSSAKVPNELQAANNMMKYVMPVMIAVFTAQLPSAVGLYWGVSTCYGILQQLVVNKGGPDFPTAPEEDVKVRIIHK